MPFGNEPLGNHSDPGIGTGKKNAGRVAIREPKSAGQRRGEEAVKGHRSKNDDKDKWHQFPRFSSQSSVGFIVRVVLGGVQDLERKNRSHRRGHDPTGSEQSEKELLSKRGFVRAKIREKH